MSFSIANYCLFIIFLLHSKLLINLLNPLSKSLIFLLLIRDDPINRMQISFDRTALTLEFGYLSKELLLASYLCMNGIRAFLIFSSRLFNLR